MGNSVWSLLCSVEPFREVPHLEGNFGAHECLTQSLWIAERGCVKAWGLGYLN